MAYLNLFNLFRARDQDPETQIDQRAAAGRARGALPVVQRRVSQGSGYQPTTASRSFPDGHGRPSCYPLDPAEKKDPAASRLDENVMGNCAQRSWPALGRFRCAAKNLRSRAGPDYSVKAGLCLSTSGLPGEDGACAACMPVNFVPCVGFYDTSAPMIRKTPPESRAKSSFKSPRFLRYC